MKKRILTFGVLLILVIFSVVPGVVLAADTTEVIGNVEEGYTFQAPSAIDLGTMTPSATHYKANATDGHLVGNNPAGYSVSGWDAGGTGCMHDGVYLANPLLISNEDSNYVTADNLKYFLDTSGPTDTTFSLHVSQLVSYTDTPGAYTITITFFVAPKA